MCGVGGGGKSETPLPLVPRVDVQQIGHLLPMLVSKCPPAREYRPRGCGMAGYEAGGDGERGESG